MLFLSLLQANHTCNVCVTVSESILSIVVGMIQWCWAPLLRATVSLVHFNCLTDAINHDWSSYKLIVIRHGHWRGRLLV